ncbi:MAG: hypothetical protein WC177_04290 [Bacilli bacterium]
MFYVDGSYFRCALVKVKLSANYIEENRRIFIEIKKSNKRK